MTFAIMNSAMIPNEGIFSYRTLTRDEAAAWLAAHSQTATSYVSYPQTAFHINALAGNGWRCPLNRQGKCVLAPGDEAFICKLAFRPDQRTKGQIQPDDWEYGLLRRLRIPEKGETR